MTETIDDAAAAEARAEAARLARKERREAKIKAGGTSRLNKISGIGGGLQRDEVPAAPETTTAPPRPTAAAAGHADPEEVDISQHFYTPEATRRRPQPAGGGMPDMTNLSEAQLRALMLGGGAGPGPGFDAPPPQAGNPFGGLGGAGAGDDPMMQMMMQMLGGAGASPFPFPPPGAAGFPPGGSPAAAVVPNKSTSIWRLLHTALALGLGLYIALWTSFRGTKGERTLASVAGGAGDEDEEVARKRFFYAFATAEAVLLTTRYFLDRGGLGGAGSGGAGVLGMVVGFLPPPVKGWVEMGMRYARVLGTVRGDVLVLVFVLGVCSWVRG